MTKNRARIRATKALAANSDIRHPEASYLADHRKLRLPDGSIYDFADGPLRLYGSTANNVESLAHDVEIAAINKGWKNIPLTCWHEGAIDFPLPSIRERSDAIIVLNEADFPKSDPRTRKTFDDLNAGIHKDLNVLVVRPQDAAEAGTPARGRNIVLAPINEDHELRTPDGTSRTAYGQSEIEHVDAKLDSLGIPKAAQEFATQSSGLFLITGQTGAGKTTTAVTLINRARLENLHPAYAIVEAYEAGFASTSGAQIVTVDGAGDTPAAIRWARRAGAGIILVDDLRDSASAAAAVEAALSGALVFATLHSSASDAAQRLTDMLPVPDPADGQDAVDRALRDNQAKVDSVLRGVVEQVLVRKTDGQGRVLASEVWVGDDGLSPLHKLEGSLVALLEREVVLPTDANRALGRRW